MTQWNVGALPRVTDASQTLGGKPEASVPGISEDERHGNGSQPRPQCDGRTAIACVLIPLTALRHGDPRTAPRNPWRNATEPSGDEGDSALTGVSHPPFKSPSRSLFKHRPRSPSRGRLHYRKNDKLASSPSSCTDRRVISPLGVLTFIKRLISIAYFAPPIALFFA